MKNLFIASCFILLLASCGDNNSYVVPAPPDTVTEPTGDIPTVPPKDSLEIGEGVGEPSGTTGTPVTPMH